MHRFITILFQDIMLDDKIICGFICVCKGSASDYLSGNGCESGWNNDC